MSNWKTILGILVTLGVLPALVVAGPPDKTQQCIATGEIVSVPDGVEIGTSVGAWVLLDGDAPGVLWLDGNLLTNANNNPELVGGTFYGQARMLKSNGPEGARFDFEFDTFANGPCISPPSDCGPPPWGDNDNCCPYRLVLRDGIYNKKADYVEYKDYPARIDLADYSQEGVDDYTVRTGQVITNIFFQFLPEGDDGGGGDPPPGECLPKETACTDDNQCCSLDCKRSFTCR